MVNLLMCELRKEGILVSRFECVLMNCSWMSCAMFGWPALSAPLPRSRFGLPLCCSWNVWKVLLRESSRSVGTLLLSVIRLPTEAVPAACWLAAAGLELANWK